MNINCNLASAKSSLFIPGSMYKKKNRHLICSFLSHINQLSGVSMTALYVSLSIFVCLLEGYITCSFLKLQCPWRVGWIKLYWAATHFYNLHLSFFCLGIKILFSAEPCVKTICTFEMRTVWLMSGTKARLWVYVFFSKYSPALW